MGDGEHVNDQHGEWTMEQDFEDTSVHTSQPLEKNQKNVESSISDWTSRLNMFFLQNPCEVRHDLWMVMNLSTCSKYPILRLQKSRPFVSFVR